MALLRSALFLSLTDIHMANDCHSLIATCTTYKGNTKISELGLNHCFVNKNGDIKLRDDGGAFPENCKRNGNNARTVDFSMA
ncbi:hypothetical protein BDV06DRAFT_226867 [Aspergillus oleicola]